MGFLSMLPTIGGQHFHGDALVHVVVCWIVTAGVDGDAGFVV